MHAMLRGLVEQGFDVHLLAMNTSRHYVDTVQLPPIYKEIGFTTFKIDTEIRPLPLLKNWVFDKEPSHAARFYNEGYEEELGKLIADFDPQIIRLESIFLATYIPAIRKISKAKVVIRLHNIEHQIWERMAAGYNYSLRRYYIKNLSGRMRSFEQAAWQQADLLLPISKEDEDMVKSEGIKTPMHLTPFGIDVKPNTETTAGKTGINQAYHLGAMDWMPNADGIKWFVEDVWPHVHKAVPQLQFTFAGRGMPPAFVKLQGKGVTNVGEVPDADAFIKDKKILIVPLQSGSGIRIKVLEAMAAGKLVVSTAIGMQGITEAKPCVHYLEANDANEFAKALSWAVNNPNDVATMCDKATQLIATYYNHQAIMNELKMTLSGIIDG